MHVSEAFDETFNPAQSAQCDLLLVLSRTEISIAVHDSVRSQFVAHVATPVEYTGEGTWASAFSSLREQYPWLSGTFHSVRLGWRAELFTLVPAELFREEHAKSLLEALGPFRALDVVYYNRLSNGAVLSFAVPSEMLQAARALQPVHMVIHPDASLHLLALSLFRKSNGILIHLDGAFATLLLFSQGALQAMLPVRASAAEDILYRLLALLNARGMEPAETPFLLVGSGLHGAKDSRGKGSPLSTAAVGGLLERYLPRIEAHLQVPMHPFSYLIDSVREEYLALFSMILCE